MESLRRLAGRLDEAAALLAAGARAADGAVPSAVAFGGDAPGRLGELGRALHTEALSTAVARGREAASAAGRLTETARALRAASDAYAESDDAARRRLLGEG